MEKKVKRPHVSAPYLDRGGCPVRIKKTRTPWDVRAGRNRVVRGGQAKPKYITRAEGELLLDRQARKYLKMSGVEFKRKFQNGEIISSDHPDVTRVSFLIPMSEKDEDE